MPSQFYSTDEIKEAVATYGSGAAAARALGMKEDTVNARLRRAREKEDPYPVVPGKSVMYDADGSVKLVWATGKGQVQGMTPEALSETLMDCLASFTPPKPYNPEVQPTEHLASMTPLVDLHMGLKIWGDECGKDWDISIAEKELLASYREVISLAPHVERGMVIGKGDLLHADNYMYQTGTPGTTHVLDCDSRYPKMLWSGINVVIAIVHMQLEKSQTVYVRILPGNHDVQSSVSIAVAVAMYFNNNPRVEVDLNPGPHWCHQWGKVMLAASHGDKLKPSNMAETFAAYYPEIWGSTRFRYFYSGHEHRERVQQRPGATVETLAAPVPIDSYAHSHGYLSSRHVQSMVYHKTKGRVLTLTEPVV